MSQMKEMELQALRRACEHLGIVSDYDREDFAERWFLNQLTIDEEAAVFAEVSKLQRTYAMPELPKLDIEADNRLSATVARVNDDLEGNARQCCDCSISFRGPGPRCPACVAKRDAAHWARVGPGLLEACRQALVRLDHLLAEETGPCPTCAKIRAAIAAAEKGA